MKPSTKRWIAKAEGDWIVARREARARKDVIYDAVCFHAQQCAEKYLKARIVEAGIAPEKTHDLETLLKLLLPIEPGWSALRNDLKFLNDFAVAIRYPDASATEADAQQAIESCHRVRQVIRAAFGLPV